MNEILSNEEIDTLLQMFRSEGAALEVEPQPRLPASLQMPVDDRVVAPMDLLKPNRLGREELRGLERYFESAGKMLSATMSDKLRLDARCDCVAVEQLRFGTWLEQLPGPVAIYVLDMKPFRLPVLFTASTSMLYSAVDRILGGSGKINKVPKEFTVAEYTVAATTGRDAEDGAEGVAGWRITASRPLEQFRVDSAPGDAGAFQIPGEL